MKRVFTNILCNEVESTAQFYQKLFGLNRHFGSDWFIILTDPDIPNFEYGLLQRDHEIIPISERASPAGILITFVVADCNQVHETAKDLNVDIIEPPTDMPYGQRRMLLRDPEGTCIDVSSPV